MANRKMNARYHFTVEGETEKWYLEWLRDAINADPRSKVKVVCSGKDAGGSLQLQFFDEEDLRQLAQKLTKE